MGPPALRPGSRPDPGPVLVVSPLVIVWLLLGLGAGAAVGVVALQLRIRALSWQAAAAEAEQVLDTVNACPDCSTAWVEHWHEVPGVPRAGKLLRVKACHHHHPPDTSAIGMIEFDPDSYPLTIEWMLP